MNKRILSVFVFSAALLSLQAQDRKGGISDAMLNQIKQPASCRLPRTRATTRITSPSLALPRRTPSRSTAPTAPSTTGACGIALCRAAWAATWLPTWLLATK